MNRNQKIIIIAMMALFLTGLTACGGGSVGSDSTGEDRSGEEGIVVVSFGGDYQAAQQKAMFEPFQEETGIKITEDHPVDTGKLKAMVDNKNVQWDVVDVLGSDVPRLISQGLLEAIDYDIVSKENMLETAVNEYSVDIDYYSTVLSYNTENLPDEETPNSWEDFFDLEKFPGNRALYKTPITTLEIALMADGVTKEDLYPLDVDRAFDKLDEIKTNIIWWEEGAQPVQLLADKEVVMASAWNGRIVSAVDKGQPLAFTYQNGLLDAESWVVPKGTNHKETAMEFINFASQAEPQARLVEKVSYGPTNEKAFEFLDEEFAKTLPTYEENLEQQSLLDVQWWDENFDEINDRFQAWLLE